MTIWNTLNAAISILVFSDNFIQYEIHTETIAFEVFGVPKSIELDMAQLRNQKH